jgi:micrococcal nuclease
MPRLILTFLFILPGLLPSCNPIREQQKQVFYPVKEITDGDTFWIDDGTERGLKIRLIGIDAPESRRTGRKEIGYFGSEAKHYLAELLTGQQVRLIYDVDRYDQYQRTLAYVYLEDGTFVNAELIRQGYARVMTVPPNVRYAEKFVKLQQRARRKGLGLWDD